MSERLRSNSRALIYRMVYRAISVLQRAGNRGRGETGRRRRMMEQRGGGEMQRRGREGNRTRHKEDKRRGREKKRTMADEDRDR